MGVKRIGKGIALLTLLLGLWKVLPGLQAGSGVQISYSPDGRAFTTNSGDTAGVWYEKGTTVRIQEENSELKPETGEHLYYWERTGEIPISYWRVAHPYGKCIHNSYGQSSSFHGVVFNGKKCYRNYYSGWLGYCRDCGELAAGMLLYMSADTAAAITKLEVGTGYYYLCPWCGNLEQGSEILPHMCRAVSANRYEILYDSNGGSGYMMPSTHMYNDTAVYEGREVTPQTHLSSCGFRRMGYRFGGWNTKPDGTGQAFGDGERIRNLSDREGGQVTLYAQWIKTGSVLSVDPAGGSYDNRKEILVLPGDYGSTYLLDSGKLVPPQGYQVSFEAKGGSAVSSIVSRQAFREWSMRTPFHGQMDGSTYCYLGSDGAEDRVTALYTQQSIILPDAEKTEQSFGGWYYDSECTRPAGGAGDRFTPRENLTLYAGWVELQLQSQDNYSANRGMGAVNLSWSQRDNTNKSYKLYQQREGQAWQQISSATDIGISGSVSRSMTYTGRQGQYQIPYTGFYRLTLTGAQGGNYGSCQGGKGGLAQGTFYLSQGETLTYELGGQNGYHGGGSATAYGVGGGYSRLSSDRQGVLLIAGGGGGATQALDGMPGGSDQKNIGGNDGESGQAGGGGGSRGGSGGTWVIHRHDESCRHVHLGDAVNGGGCYTAEVTCGSVSFRQEETGSHFYYGNRNADGSLCYCVRCGGYSCAGHTDRSYRYICNGCGKDYGGSKPSVCTVRRGYALECGRSEDYICGMTEGQVLSNMPAYGGSNYINTDAGSSYTQQAGWQNGNGTLQITSVALGYLESNLLNGVAAADLGKPEKIDPDTLRLIATDENRVRVSFARPTDRGTTYYHKVESYPLGSDRRICSSNVTANTLTTQVQGYRYVVDNKAGTRVTASHEWHGDPGDFPSLSVVMKNSLQYLHIAAQDKAGNLGETLHIPLSDQTVIAWPVRTEPIRLEQESGVWPSEEADTYYVRAGEEAPFTLSFQGVLCGPARKDYQVTHLFVVSQDLDDSGEEGRMGIVTPARDDLLPGSYAYRAEQLQKLTEGRPCIRDGAYTVIRRSNRCRDLEITQKLYVPKQLDGHLIRLTPAAAAQDGTEKVYSDYSQDLLGSIRIVADATPPVIGGMQQLEEMDFMEEGAEETVSVELTARDDGSGLAEFFVEVYNQDNGSSQRFPDQGRGSILLELSAQDALFSGDFTVIAHAVDHVGNETVVSSRQQGLSLHVELQRILEPHDPVFKAGESGLLTIVATGYVERIEVIFPEEMSIRDPSLNRVYEYDIPDYIKEEELSFMVPLRVPEAAMEITVRAYKQDTSIEQHPRLATMTVKGNVLDELRTRLMSRQVE